MKSITVTEFSRKIRKVLDMVEYRGEEVVLVRNKHNIAKIVPGAPHLTAMEAMADLYRTLPDDAGETWESDSRISNSSEEVRDPWAS
ncbi:MAG: type II toxin-antitoxin system Phd/YefM family antitoxin [Deltaproteobacteria bacterium]|nr:type II toxin-antitoxin system Phd/YefM family antitoxin [Deltaproteobacteria bacterium]